MAFVVSGESVYSLENVHSLVSFTNGTTSTGSGSSVNDPFISCAASC
jgi:hypothetical protein